MSWHYQKNVLVCKVLLAFSRAFTDQGQGSGDIRAPQAFENSPSLIAAACITTSTVRNQEDTPARCARPHLQCLRSW